MDFMNRGLRGNQAAPTQATQTPGSPLGDNGVKRGGKIGRSNFGPGKLGKIGSMVFLLALIVLVVGAVLTLVMFNGKDGRESGLVDKSKYQAVFLNGGQVYFGKIGDLNSKYMRVSSVYYLRVNQQVQPDANAATSQNDISLVKLGCELHGPTDEMVINREQVVFWENLKGDGQVAKAVEQYKKQFPNGQKCDEQNSSSSQNSGSSETDNQTTTPTPTPTPTTPSTNTNRR